MTSEQSPHNGNAAGPPESLTQEGNGLSGRVKGSAARFDWRESFKHLLFAVVCGVAGGFGSILLCLFVDAMRSVFVRNTWLIWLLPVAGLLELLLYKMFRIPLGRFRWARVWEPPLPNRLSCTMCCGFRKAQPRTVVCTPMPLPWAWPPPSRHCSLLRSVPACWYWSSCASAS